MIRNGTPSWRRSTEGENWNGGPCRSGNDAPYRPEAREQARQERPKAQESGRAVGEEPCGLYEACVWMGETVNFNHPNPTWRYDGCQRHLSRRRAQGPRQGRVDNHRRSVAVAVGQEGL